MAAHTLTPFQLELASSLTQDELPTKLRCAICSKLAINAFRLPCCEQAICEACQSTLPTTCPVCEHSPVSSGDCTIYKSLRTTIRVFLKTEEKKREASRPKPSGSTAPVTAIETKPRPTPILAKDPTDPFAVGIGSTGQENAGATDAVASQLSIAAAAAAVSDPSPKPGVELQGQERKRPDRDGGPNVANGEQKETVATDGLGISEVKEGDESAEKDGVEDVDRSVAALDQTSITAPFNGLSFVGGDMNQMQMMMAMQNGMNPAAFGAFPMMGMGMAMDPMTMQSMYMTGGFGVQGMGMSGMNMNMGMNGFSGGGNDWNGQQSWEIGPDNYNPTDAGMGNGNFSSFNNGFQTGYNSGSYGHNNQYNDHGRGGYGFRGRGRGRAVVRNFGRGYQQGHSQRQNYGQEHIGQEHYGQDHWADQAIQHDAHATGLDHKDGQGAEGQRPADVDKFGRTIRAAAEDHEGNGEPDKGDSGRGGSLEANQEMQGSHETTADLATDSAAAMKHGDVSADSCSNPRASSARGGDAMPPSAAAADVPLNAPTGPKAMRQGLPNTSLRKLRTLGLVLSEQDPMTGRNGSVAPNPLEEQMAVSRSSSRHGRERMNRVRHSDEDEEMKDQEPSRNGNDHKRNGRELKDGRELRNDSEEKHGARDRSRDRGDEKDRAKDRGRQRDYSRSYSRSHSRSSRSRDRKEARRHRRHHVDSVQADDREDEHRRRKHKSRRSGRDEDDHRSRTKDDRRKDRARSASPNADHRDRDSKRSGHRSRRNRNRNRGRERDIDFDRHRKSEHRPHREYDRDRDHDHDRDRKLRDREHEERKDRERERERRHRNHKTSMEPPTTVEGTSSRDNNPPSGPHGSNSVKAGAPVKGGGSDPKPTGFEIRGASSKTTAAGSSSRPEGGQPPSRHATSSSIFSAAPRKDAHTLEREARDRERLLKEAQRMAGLVGKAGGLKRGRDAAEDKGGRRKSRRGETVNDEERRMRRLEEEREGSRWD